MPRELRVSAVLPIPDDIFEQADALHAARPILATLKEQVEALGGNVSHELVTPKPRTAKEGEAA